MRVGKVIMLQLHQEFNGIRRTILKDVEYLAPRLRTEDKREEKREYVLHFYITHNSTE